MAMLASSHRASIEVASRQSIELASSRHRACSIEASRPGLSLQSGLSCSALSQVRIMYKLITMMRHIQVNIPIQYAAFSLFGF